MPKCINDESRSYTGTEPSPKGLGYCAHAEKLGIKKKGRDGNTWIIAKNTAGIQRWVRYSNKSGSKTYKQLSRKKRLSMFYGIKPSKKLNWNKWLKDLDNTQKDIIDTLTHDVQDELADNDIKLYIVPNPLTASGIYWADYPWDIVRDEAGPDYLDTDFILFIVFLRDGVFDLRDGTLRLQHNIHGRKKGIAHDIFDEHFEDRFEWNKSNRHTIDIQMT